MEAIIKDGNIDRTFIINKMKATQLDSFVSLAIKCLLKDDIKYPEGILGGDIRQSIYNIVQNGQQEDGAKSLGTERLMENLFPILRSAYANLDETDRILLLDKLISTTIYKNGVIEIPLTYFNIDSYIEGLTTIYKLAWEVLKVNFTMLSAEKS